MVGSTALIKISALKNAVAKHTEVRGQAVAEVHSVFAAELSCFREDSIGAREVACCSAWTVWVHLLQKTSRLSGPGLTPTVTERSSCHWRPAAYSWVTSSIHFCRCHQILSLAWPQRAKSLKYWWEKNWQLFITRKNSFNWFIEGGESLEDWRSFCHHAEAELMVIKRDLI